MRPLVSVLAVAFMAGVLASCTSDADRPRPSVTTQPETPSAPGPEPAAGPTPIAGPTPTPSATPPAPAALAPVPAAPLIDAPFIGRWRSIAILVFDSDVGQFRPVGFGPTTVFEFHPNGTWCVATAEAVQGCLTLRPFTTDQALIIPQDLKDGETPFRYRWRMVEQVLLLTLEQPQGDEWVPLVRWAVEKTKER